MKIRPPLTLNARNCLNPLTCTIMYTNVFLLENLMRIKKRGPRFKYEHLYPRILELLNAGTCMRKIANEVGVSLGTVQNVSNRLKI